MEISLSTGAMWPKGEIYKVYPHKIKPPMAAKSASQWNEKCNKCGKGVYRGFTSLEHDGPCV